MEKRLILSVLLVVLSWECMPTYAETNITVTSDSNANATTANPNNITTTAAPTNITTTAAPTNITTTAAPTNITTTAAPTNITTTAAPTNITTTAAPTNITTTAAPTNITTTAAPTNITTTAAPTDITTTAAPTDITTTANPNNITTTAAPTDITTTANPNNITTTAAPTNITTTAAPTNITTTATSVVESISRQECGSLKLCVDTPSKCDPASGDCYFLSAKKQSNQTYNFELSGQTEGYIAAALSTDANLNDSKIAYICANHNGDVLFFTGFFNNLVPNVTNKLNVTKMHGSVNSSKIQCTFTADLPDTEKRAARYAIGIFTGPYNSSTWELGLSKSKTQTTVVVELSDPTANLIDNSASFVYPVTHTHSFLPVLLATMCLLAG